MAKESWAARFKREDKERKDAALREVKYLAEFLALLGVKQVLAKFDGSGDEGQITETIVKPEPKAGLPPGLANAISNQIAAWIPGGWEINEGSFGTVKLDVATAKCVCDIEYRPEEDYDEDDEDW
jgi:hypothetical protein